MIFKVNITNFMHKIAANLEVTGGEELGPLEVHIKQVRLQILAYVRFRDEDSWKHSSNATRQTRPMVRHMQQESKGESMKKESKERKVHQER